MKHTNQAGALFIAEERNAHPHPGLPEPKQTEPIADTHHFRRALFGLYQNIELPLFPFREFLARRSRT